MRDLNENDIAIIGYAFDFPEGIDTNDKFWEVLKNGKDLVCEIPLNRWDWKKIYDPDPNAWGKSYSYHGAFLNDIEYFDANAFRIMPIEAKELDPQQRLVLKTAWRALENSYLNIEQLKHSDTGVFIGATMDDYLQLQTRVDCGKHINRYTHFGSVLNDISGRVSYFYGFNGPSMTIDTACSSSISAIDSAIKAINAGDCEIALAGGVNVILTEELYIKFSRTQMLSKTGSCKTFDESADGYVRGEGCGIFVLQRLSDAIKYNRNIVAVIRGISVNHNGNSGGLTVPSGKAQVMLMRNCMKRAGVTSNDIDYIEAHGTGTQLGDKIEVNSIQEVFNGRKSPLFIGSVKPNIGHLESAAGVAGIIKVLLCMEHDEFVPSIHLKQKNTKINWDNSSIEIVQDNIKWNSETKVAGISSFGAGGANGHIIIQKYDKNDQKFELEDNLDFPENFYIAVSAKSIVSLKKILNSISYYLIDKTRQEINEFCSVYNIVRSDYSYRVIICGENAESLRNDIADKIERLSDICGNREIPNESILFNIDYDLDSYKKFLKFNMVYRRYVNDIINTISPGSFEIERIIMGVGLYRFIKNIGLNKYLIVGDTYTKFILFLSSKKEDEYESYISKYLRGDKSLNKELDDYYCEDYLSEITNRVINGDIQDDILNKVVSHYEAGSNIQWNNIYFMPAKKAPQLPEYEFDEQYYWADYTKHVVDEEKNNTFLDDYVSMYREVETSEEYIISIRLRQDAEFIKQHRIYQNEVLIGTFQVILINSIVERFLGTGFVISDLYFLQKIIPTDEHELRIIIQKTDNIKNGKIIEQNDKGDWITKTIFNISLNNRGIIRKEKNARIVGRFIERDAFYNTLFCVGLNLGANYQIINSIVKDNNCFIALLNETALTPGVLDSASQLLYLYRSNDNDLYMPYYFESYEQFESIEKVNRVEGNLINKSDDELVAELSYYTDDLLVARYNGYHLRRVKTDNMYSLESIIGKHVQMPDGTDLYQYTIDFSNSSLRDHVVYNRLTIPGAYFISQIMQFAENKFGHDRFEISNISFYNAMVLEDNMLVKELTQIKHDADGYEVVICSRTGNSDIYIDNVKMQVKDINDVEDVFFEEIIESDIKNEIYLSADEIIKIQWNIGLNLSDSFHWIKEAWVYENHIRAELSNHAFSILQGSYGTPPGLIDTAVQILGLYKNYNQDNEGAYIPLTINKVIQYRKINNNLKCMVYNIKENGELLTADIVYYDSDYKKVLEFQEIGLIKADKAKLGNVNTYNKLIAEQKWVKKFINKQVSAYYNNAIEIRLGIQNKKVIITKYQLEESNWSIVDKRVYDLNDKIWLEDVLAEVTLRKMLIVLSDSSEYISVNGKKAEEVNEICKFITGFYLGVLKSFHKVDISGDVLCLATNYAYTTEFEKNNIFAGVVWGLARSLQLELADYQIVLHDSDKTLSMRIDSINQCIENNVYQVTYYNGIFKESKIVESLDEANNNLISFNSEKSYVIIGGFGALGLETCKCLVKEGVKRLIILGRSDLEKRQEHINYIYSLGKDLSIEYHKLDVSKSSEESRLKEILHNEKHIGGVIYAAGVVKDRIYSNYTEDDIQTVYASKINGVITLFSVLREIEYDFCVCYSSIVSVMGAAGQSVYGAANSFIDSLCNYVNKTGKKVFSIQWGPWAKIGMFSKLDSISVKRYELRNIFAMNSEEAIEAFKHCLNNTKNQIIMKQNKTNNQKISFISKKQQLPLSKISKSNDKTIIEELKEIVSDAIGMNDFEQLKTDISLMELGIDSLLMVEIRMKINKLFNVNISLDKFFDKMTIEKLNDIIEKE